MSRRWIIAIGGLTAFLLMAGAAAVWATVYDRNTSGRLLPGTVIQGVPVGDLEADDAIQLLKDRLESPLRRPVQLKAGEFEMSTSAWDLGLQVEVRAAVRRALGQADGSLPTRLWKRLFSHPERVVAAVPRWREGQLEEVMAQAASAIAVAPQDARLEAATGWLSVVSDRPGRELDLELSREAVRDGITLGDDVVRLATRDVPAAIGKDAFRQVILVRTGENQLYLYENGTIKQQWPVATGKTGFETPTGNWQVVEKIVNPVWYNPGSAWARGMPAQIGPGPHNPLGTRALALSAPAILIHATSDRSSIGFGASHGCIRMVEEHELELFNQVDVGTPVVIVAAGEPRPRESIVLPGDPVQAAAVQF